MIILKFGGTSLSSKAQILTITQIVRNALAKRPILVVSAVSGVTEALLKKDIKSVREIHEKLIYDLFPSGDIRGEVINYLNEQLRLAEELASRENLSPAQMDELVSYGEIISSYIISKFLENQGIASRQVVATDLIITDNSFMQAEFLPMETEKSVRRILGPMIQEEVVPVVTGFIGSTKDGRVTTLGRGGSDYSASIIGYCLGVSEIQIWTDVDGIYTADPRFVKNARLIPEISYREASEMAVFGAKVLHPRTIKPAISKNIPVRILNTFNPRGLGTVISSNSTGVGLKAISFKRKTKLVNISSASMLFAQGFLKRVFEIFSRENISVDLVSVSEVSISVTLDNVLNLKKVVKDLREFSTVSLEHNFGTISLIGEEIVSSNDLIKSVFEILHKNNIPIRMISMGASNINISLVLNCEDIEKAVRLIHEKI